MVFLIALLFGFAWAIGGEKYFGKWRRGLLVLIPTVLAGIVFHAVWWYYAAMLALFYPIYQGLFFDKAIKLIFPDSGTTNFWQKLLGWLLVFVNGLMVGTMPMVLFLATNPLSWVKSLLAVGLCGIFFMWAIFQSNVLKLHFAGDIRIDGVKIWCPADSWWLACWCFGILCGTTYFLR